MGLTRERLRRTQQEAHVVPLLDVKNLRDREAGAREQQLHLGAAVVVHVRIVEIDDRMATQDVVGARQFEIGDAVIGKAGA